MLYRLTFLLSLARADSELQVARVEGRLSVNGCALLDKGQRIGRHMVIRIDGLIA